MFIFSTAVWTDAHLQWCKKKKKMCSFPVTTLTANVDLHCIMNYLKWVLISDPASCEVHAVICFLHDKKHKCCSNSPSIIGSLQSKYDWRNGQMNVNDEQQSNQLPFVRLTKHTTNGWNHSGENYLITHHWVLTLHPVTMPFQTHEKLVGYSAVQWQWGFKNKHKTWLSSWVGDFCDERIQKLFCQYDKCLNVGFYYIKNLIHICRFCLLCM